MKNVFVCTTQYQLFNIVNIINQDFSEDINELLIVGFVPALKARLEELAAKSEKFSRITFIKTGRADGTIKSYIGCAFKILCPSLIPFKAYSINRLFISSTEIFSRIIAYKFFGCSDSLEIYYFEDGLESYMEVLDSSVKNRTNRLLSRRFGYSLISKCCGMYVYKPSYVISNPYNIKLYTINPMDIDSPYVKELYQLFSVDKPIRFPLGTAIFLDAWFVNKIDKANSEKLISLVLNIAKERMAIKPHPSNYDELKKNQKNTVLIDSKDNFEIIYMNGGVKDAILISAFSTACLLPKLIFNEEPKVILLYRLFERYPDVWKSGEEFYLRVQKDYTNPDNFIIPNNLDELEEALKVNDLESYEIK